MELLIIGGVAWTVVGAILLQTVLTSGWVDSWPIWLFRVLLIICGPIGWVALLTVGFEDQWEHPSE